jgi:hypothetical protein
MKSVPRCLIHIGAPKTGSTLLERACFDNREALGEHGILYPDVSLRGFGHHDLAFLLSGGYPPWAAPQSRSLEDLAADLRSKLLGHYGAILFSSEDFYLYPNPRGLMELLKSTGAIKDRQPLIIVYVRRQDDAHESWYNQTVKAQGYTHDVDTSVRDFYDLFDYGKQLSGWAEVFGQGAILVRPFHQSEFYNGELLQDFLSILGVDGGSFATPDERINTSLNRDILEFQRILNALPLSVRVRRRYHRELMELSARAAGSSLFDERPMLDPRKRAEILDAYASSNREVARIYLRRDELFPIMEQREQSLSLVQPGLNVEKLSAILGWLLLRDD